MLFAAQGCTGGECEHPAEEYSLASTEQKQDDEAQYYAEISVEGPFECGRRPDCYRAVCKVVEYDGRPAGTGFELNMFARLSDGSVDGLAYRGAMPLTRLEATLAAETISEMTSIGCNIGIPERRVCIDGAEYCYVLPAEHISTTEAELDIAGDVCLDYYYNAPDYPWRGGRNLER